MKLLTQYIQRGVAGLATLATAALPFLPLTAQAASHFETPDSYRDPAADITDFYAFVSPQDANRTVLVMSTHGMQQPTGGPYYGKFDPTVVYRINVDNNQDAKPDVTFTVKFNTEAPRIKGIPLGFIGAGAGLNAPGNSPDPVKAGTQIIPAEITNLSSAGLSQRQHYVVTMTKNGKSEVLNTGKDLIAVPANVGPRTMPNYEQLVQAGIFDIGKSVRAFAGVTDDAFNVDLGGIFDSLKLKSGGVLTAAQDKDDVTNSVKDSLQGLNVNTIALEVPTNLLTAGGEEPSNGLKADNPRASLGFWATTLRGRVQVEKGDMPSQVAPSDKDLVQVARMGNPLINEVIIPTELKSKWARSTPDKDKDYAAYALDPVLARVVNTAFAGAVEIAPPPRLDLLPLVTYKSILGLNVPAANSAPAGPIADLVRLNVAVPQTPVDKQSRLGLLAADAGGFPNGRRVSDDVVDIALRVVPGSVLAGTGQFNKSPNNMLGDGVNSNAGFLTDNKDLASQAKLNSRGYRNVFPFIAPANPGNN